MQGKDKSAGQQRYAAAWTDYLATEAVKAGHLVTGHVAAMLAGDAGGGQGAAIIDLGCGTGALHGDLRTAGAAFSAYLGVDANPFLVEQARAGAGAGATFAVADLADAAGPDRALDLALRLARPEASIFTLIRVLNYLPDPAAALLLGKLAERAAGARFVILDAYPGPLDRPDKDNPLQSAIEAETMGEALIVHHLRDPFQYVDFLSARNIGGLNARAAYLRGPAAPSHFTIAGCFGARA